MYEFNSSSWKGVQTLGLWTLLVQRTMIVYTVYMIVQLFIV